MQFKVVSALIFATLVTAGALPRDTNPNPANTNSPNNNSSNNNSPNNNSPNNNSPNNSPNTNSPNTNSPNTNPTNTNHGTTNQGTNIAPPFPGNPLPTIGASKCSEGHLRCCKSAQSPTAPAVTPLLPSGISAASISGLVGVTCAALPVGAKPDDCSEKPVCCTDNSHGNTVSLGCNQVNLNL